MSRRVCVQQGGLSLLRLSADDDDRVRHLRARHRGRPRVHGRLRRRRHHEHGLLSGQLRQLAQRVHRVGAEQVPPPVATAATTRRRWRCYEQGGQGGRGGGQRPRPRRRADIARATRPHQGDGAGGHAGGPRLLRRPRRRRRRRQSPHGQPSRRLAARARRGGDGPPAGVHDARVVLLGDCATVERSVEDKAHLGGSCG